MPSYKCPTCGREHDALPMDLAYRRPADYFKIPEGERATRIRIDADLCTIDFREFYIRGVLPLPLRNRSDEFRWGVWARVSEDDFFHYVELWDAEIALNEPPLTGYLSGGIRDYAQSDGLEVKAYLQSKGMRPRFTVVSEEHPLGRDQRSGITMERVHEFVAPFLDELKS